MALNLATRITLTRLILAPAFVTAAAYHRYRVAVVLFVIAGLTDALDGMVARALNQRTRTGAVLDVLADKFLLSSAFIVLCLVPGTVRVPVWLTILVFSRDILIILVIFALFVITGRRDFAPSKLGKATTLVQIVYVTWVLAANAVGLAPGPLVWLRWITGGITVASGLGYMTSITRQAAAHPGEAAAPPQ